ncbi:MAG: hypothetical protein KGS72_17525 [Cyanobacteria bacterium REEB67]|nr:hypothetical protein [Cyanobacteria bacterium REEB67]
MQTQISRMRAKVQVIDTQLKALNASRKEAETALKKFYNKTRPVKARYYKALRAAFAIAFPDAGKARADLESANTLLFNEIGDGEPVDEFCLRKIETALNLIESAIIGPSTAKDTAEDTAAISETIAAVRTNIAGFRSEAYRSKRRARAWENEICKALNTLEVNLHQVVEPIGYKLIEQSQLRRARKAQA